MAEKTISATPKVKEGISVMAHISADRFYSSGGSKTQRVRLLVDQVIKGVPLSKGDTVDLPLAEATYSKAIERVEFVAVIEPKQATR